MTISRYLLCPGFGLMLLLPATHGWGAPALESGILQYEIRTTRRGSPPSLSEAHAYFKGQYYRLDRTYSNGRGSVILNGPDGLFLINTTTGEAQKAPGGAGFSHDFLLPITRRSSNRFDKKVGSEKIGDYPTDIYETANPATLGIGTWRRWWSRDHPMLLVKEERERQDLGERQITLLKSAQLNVAVPDDRFLLPKGIKVRQPLPPAANRTMSAKATATSNLNRVAAAVRHYARTHDGMLPPMDNRLVFEAAVSPFLPAREAFMSPQTRVAFKTVSALSGKKLSEIKEAHRRVVLYSGAPEPDGKRLVAYLDCRVVAVSGDAWQQLVREQKLPEKSP